MSSTHETSARERCFEAADLERSALRAAVSEINRLIGHQPSARAGGDRGLAASWAALVKLLALGPPRELRDCPNCGRPGMREATRCGHCWERLQPLPPAADVRQVAGGGADS